MTKEILTITQLDMVAGGLIEANLVSWESDGRLQEILRQRKWMVQDREWEHKVWQAYQENGRKWVGTALDVVKTGIEAGKIFIPGSGAAGKAKDLAAAPAAEAEE